MGGPMIEVGKKVLVTTDCWFMAPDGTQYSAVFGTVKAVRSDEQTLGIKTNRGSTNWYAEIGRMTIAGCQIHYAIECDSVNAGEVTDYVTEDGECKRFTRPSRIYMAD